MAIAYCFKEGSVVHEVDIRMPTLPSIITEYGPKDIHLDTSLLIEYVVSIPQRDLIDNTYKTLNLINICKIQNWIQQWYREGHWFPQNLPLPYSSKSFGIWETISKHHVSIVDALRYCLSSKEVAIIHMANRFISEFI